MVSRKDKTSRWRRQSANVSENERMVLQVIVMYGFFEQSIQPILRGQSAFRSARCLFNDKYTHIEACAFSVEVFTIGAGECTLGIPSFFACVHFAGPTNCSIADSTRPTRSALKALAVLACRFLTGQ